MGWFQSCSLVFENKVSISFCPSLLYRGGNEEVQLFCPPLPIPVLHGHRSWLHSGRGATPLVPHHRLNLRKYKCRSISALHTSSSCPKQHLLWEGACPRAFWVSTVPQVSLYSHCRAALCCPFVHPKSQMILCIFLKWVRSQYVQDAVQRENRSDFNINLLYNTDFY